MASASSMPTRWCTARRKRDFRSTSLSSPLWLTSRDSHPGQRSNDACPGFLTIKTIPERTRMLDLIVHNAKIATNGIPSFVQAIAIADGNVVASGTNQDILRQRGPETRAIDDGGRTVIPGLNDSHMHPIRGGLNYNLELRL